MEGSPVRSHARHPHWPKLAFPLAFCLGLAACGEAPNLTPATSGREATPRLLRLEGSPAEIGTRHGTLLARGIKTMLAEYVREDVEAGKLKPAMLARVKALKPSLPEWYKEELSACAKAANVDEDVLLLAQCEGDLRSLPGCTVYVAFGASTHDGHPEIGRNFDYWGLESTDPCAMLFAVVPRKEDGYAFVAVGWTGILGGWTLFNEKGLFVACNLGGFTEKDPKGVPAMILMRTLAQKAATLNEAVGIIRKTPRMRGCAMIIGQMGDPNARTPHDAAVVLYDAATVEVKPHTNGLAFHTSIGTDPQQILGILRQPDRKPTDAIHSVGTSITLHSAALRPQAHTLWVAHGQNPYAHRGGYVEYDLKQLLQR
jgi:hypothetical protein